MGNARSSARRIVDAFAMDGSSSSSSAFTEPLLPADDAESPRMEDSANPAYRRKGVNRIEAKQLQCAGPREEPALDLAAVTRQLNSFYAVIWPVAITMIVASLVASYARDAQLVKAMTTYMYYRDIDNSSDSVGEKSMLALMNALVVIAFIACLTVMIVALYKFNCMRFFLGYCIFYSASLLALAGTKIVVVVLGHNLHMVFDSVSHWFVMYNFAVVGVVSIFYQKGMPTIVEQGYLVAISVIVAWQLSQLPEWSTWMILFLLGFWDLFAVLTPCGPLRWLVDLVHEKGTPLPGLLYRAAIADSHQAKEAPHAIEIEPTRARMSESEFISWLLSPVRTPDTSARQSPPPPTQVLDFHQQVVSFLFDQRSNAQYRALDISQRYTGQQIKLWRSLYTYYEIRTVSPGKPYPSIEVIFGRVATSPPDPQLSDSDDEDESIRLGLGDFIFYSVLVARAAMHGVAPFVACFFCVIAGLGVTMYLLAHYDALPALPISVFSGIFGYLLTVQLLAPLVDYLTSFSIMAL